jgi:hypothetical protein
MTVMVYASLALEERVVSPSTTPLRKGLESLVVGPSPDLDIHIAQALLQHNILLMPNRNNQVVPNSIPKTMPNSMFQKVPNHTLMNRPHNQLINHLLQKSHHL